MRIIAPLLGKQTTSSNEALTTLIMLPLMTLAGPPFHMLILIGKLKLSRLDHRKETLMVIYKSKTPKPDKLSKNRGEDLV